MPGNKRSAPRTRLKYPARIDAGDGSHRDCILADVSDTGARVLLKDANPLPERFMLLMGSKGSAAPRACRLVWRVGAEIGVEFDKDSRPPKPKAPVLNTRPRRS